MIEEFDDDNALCGLTKDGVSTALMLPASSARFRVFAITSPAQSREALLYLRIDTVIARPTNPAWPIDGCVSTIQLSARALQNLTLTATQRSVFATVLLWSRTNVATSPRSGHSKVVGKEVENLTESFITDWNLDNRAN
jgi:hypothetical protein